MKKQTLENLFGTLVAGSVGLLVIVACIAGAVHIVLWAFTTANCAL